MQVGDSVAGRRRSNFYSLAAGDADFLQLFAPSNLQAECIYRTVNTGKPLNGSPRGCSAFFPGVTAWGRPRVVVYLLLTMGMTLEGVSGVLGA